MIASLANHLWQSTLVAGLAWLTTLALRRDRAGVRYGVWLAASLKFLVPFSLLTALGERFGWHPTVFASAVPLRMVIDTAVPLVAAPSTAAAHQSLSSPLAAVGSTLPALLVAAWALGAAALVATWIVRWRRVASLVRSAASVDAGPIFEMLRRREHATGLQRPIALALSDSSLEPGIFGIVTPTLVWPARIDEHLTLDQIDGIIAHEVAHVRRRDNLAAAIHMCVQAAFWFNPVVWWIGARLVDERERACDEAVVTAGSAPETYAESILKTCQFYAEAPLTCVAGVTGSELKKRIEHIMTNTGHRAMSIWKKCLLVTVASAALAVPLLVGALHVQPVLAQAGSNAAFDVTSVKPNNSGSGQIMMLPAANAGWQASNVTLGMLVRMAFQVQDSQITGGPKWLFEDRFDVMGTGVAAGRNGPLFDKLKALLVDRFHLVTHMEKREQSMYALVLARTDGKLGEKMTPSTADCSAPQGPAPGQRGFAPPAPGQRPRCGFGIGPAA